MIKIEFKGVQILIGAMGKFDFNYDNIFNDSFFRSMGRASWFGSYELRAVTPYIPTQDLMLDREHILKIQGITKEQDEANQKEWAKI